MNKHTPGPWMVATSNSWRRIVSRDHGQVCEPIVQNDGHADLHFKNGGEDGPDARLLAAAPDMLEALEAAFEVIDNQVGPCEAFDKVQDAIMKARGPKFS